jgi:uncharacterized repeat protein (TIGR03843 family)
MPELNLHLRDEETGELIPQPELEDDDALALLTASEITAAELVPWGSNYTFAVALETDDAPAHLGIYKPMAGERPLHDFRYGSLHNRERASYLVSRALGWGIVPPTVIRDGPHGVGSLQIYVPAQPESVDNEEYWGQRTREIERMVLFDHIANNADRKLTHCLVSLSGRVVGIDHGLTFHHHPKLRTALWQFVGRPIDDELIGQVRELAADLDDRIPELRALLTEDEHRAFRERMDRLVGQGRYPMLDPRLNIPYGWW